MPFSDVDGDVLLVSPHLDDAILSCEAWIGNLRTVDLLTVFCGRPSPAVHTDWDLRAGFADSDDAVSTRLKEDATAFAGTSHRRHFLDLIDSQYLDRPRCDAEATVLRAWVDSWLDGATDPVVLAPVGAGLRPPAMFATNPVLAKGAVAIERRLRRIAALSPSRRLMTGRPPHHDHLWVSEVISDHLAHGDARLAFYSEVPYGRGGNGRRALATMSARHGWTTSGPEHVWIDRQAKAARIGAYRSQIVGTSDQTGRLDHPAGLEPAETYWFVVSRSARPRS